VPKVCNKCRIGTEFHKGAWYCKTCANENSRKHHHRRMKEEPGYRLLKREAGIKYDHGISLEEYLGRLAQQDHLCAICKVELLTHGSGTHLDHDHKTGSLRAFLCTNCNRGLGHFKDSILNLRQAVEYLNTHSSGVNAVDRS
jgi:NMD protein affecting ribosome stability and mRNA decay